MLVGEQARHDRFVDVELVIVQPHPAHDSVPGTAAGVGVSRSIPRFRKDS
jgi:hypothetical protein